MLVPYAFYLFASLLLIAAVAVITARNTVHSVLFLIFAFFNVAGLFVLLGAEFLAMLLLIVYVGAIAVLFLFVVMMLDVSKIETRPKWRKYLPIGGGLGAIMIAELIVLLSIWQDTGLAQQHITKPTPSSDVTSNSQALGELIYTDYVLIFQTAGLILLVAMIGAITLTMRRRAGVRRQDVNAQVERDPKKVMKVKQPKSGEGVAY